MRIQKYHFLKMHFVHSRIHFSNNYFSASYYRELSYNSNYQKQSAPSPVSSSSGNKINPEIIFIIIILAIIFFILGLLHLLVRFLTKHRSSLSSSSLSSISQSNRFPEMSESDAYQRQLQQLFHLHDSGLDQAFIDALPVFFYKEIIGLNEPFDCAVCLCEFLEQDKLRLLPNCNHAFHIHCIDSWLLSNSTCPLCRGTLYGQGFSFENENSVFDFECSREENGVSFETSVNKTTENHIMNGKRVFSVGLGKFRSSNNGEVVERSEGESSGTCNGNFTNLNVRRCYSMESIQYVLADSYLQVALNPIRDGSMRQLKRKNGKSSIDIREDVEGKKVNIARKSESFSNSKIWQWSKKEKTTSSSHTHFHNFDVNATLPWMNKARGT